VSKRESFFNTKGMCKRQRKG